MSKNELQSQLNHQKAMWNQLKELLEKDIKKCLNSDNELVQHSIEVEQWVLDKMQELEKGEKDVKD